MSTDDLQGVEALVASTSPSQPPPLPDELVQMIVDVAASMPALEATTVLRKMCLLSAQWRRIATVPLQRSPVIGVARPRAAESLRRRLVLASDPLDALHRSVSLGEKPSDEINAAHRWIQGIKRLQIAGTASWRHRASAKNRPPLITPANLISILNYCQNATELQCLALVELPWVSSCGFVGHVKPWPASLTTLLLLTPSTPSELFALLHNFINLEHLAIGSCDSEDPRLGMVAYTSPAPYALKSFGIVCRAAERWLKTGLPWGLRDLQWIVRGRSTEQLSSLHLELADDDDVCTIIEMLDQSPLRSLRLRSVTQMTMTAALLLCKDLKELHLSSIYATALRTSSPVWGAIPASIGHLSIDITRLDGHGPWNARSAAGLAGSIAEVVGSGRCKELRTVGSIFERPGFEFSGKGEGSAGTETADMREVCAASEVKLVPSTFDDSFVTLADGSHWY